MENKTKLPEYSVSNDAEIALYLIRPNHSTGRKIVVIEREEADKKIIEQQEIATKYKEMLQIEDSVGFLGDTDMHYISLLAKRMHTTKLIAELTNRDFSEYYNNMNDELHQILVHSGSYKGVKANLTKTSKVEHSMNEIYRDYTSQDKRKKGLLGLGIGPL